MLVKTLSVSNPWATYICAGLKDVENRNWSTKHRGRLLIHVPASEKGWAWPDDRYLPPSWQEEYDKWINIKNKPADSVPEGKSIKFWKLFLAMHDFYGVGIVKTKEDMAALEAIIDKKGCFMPSGAIVGECVVVDCVKKGECESEWRQDVGANTHHWILENPILYEKPLKNIAGKMRLWDFDMAGVDWLKPLAL